MQGRGFSRYTLLLGLILALVWGWSAYRPVYPHDWLLENYLVFLFVPLIGLLGFYFRLSNLSYTLITLFMVLHLVGAHYTYAEVPFGFRLQEWFGASRNLYDRLVHFSFGLLLAYPLREMFVRVTRARGFWGFYLPVELTLAFSALYEVIEWLVAEAVDPAAGLAFLGAQGDVWDTQKDMLLAVVGSVLAMILTLGVTLVVDPDAPREFRDSFRLPPDDRPIGEQQLLAWWRSRRGT